MKGCKIVDGEGKQMSETIRNSIFLAMSGGFQDAYTYFVRDKVFSNAQTGNIVLMSQHYMSGEWMEGTRYLFPLVAFAVGVFVAERYQNRYRYSGKLHWRQGILMMEILILAMVGLLPLSCNILATVLVSFTCAMQVQTFRKINGYNYASTMCIGNLRSGTEALSVFLRSGESGALQKAMHYFGVILVFGIGAGLGGKLSVCLGTRAIWISCGLLMISFLLMFREQVQ